MKNRTKLVSLLLALALLLAMLPATVLAESPQENPPPVTGEYEVVITDRARRTTTTIPKQSCWRATSIPSAACTMAPPPSMPPTSR